MLNRSATTIRYSAAFCDWLRGVGVVEADGSPQASRTIYLMPAFEDPDEAEEVVEDLFEEIFRRELRAWQPDEAVWPDTADFDLFCRWFTVESFPIVEDIGRDGIWEENGRRLT